MDDYTRLAHLDTSCDDCGEVRGKCECEDGFLEDSMGFGEDDF